MGIKLLKNSEIDFIAYDNCVESSQFGTVYAMSWYLNVVSPDWQALISDNYEIVMPLPVKNKLGFSYLTQPYFSQQLGVFSSKEIIVSDFQAFLNAIPFKYYHLQLNSGNIFDFGIEDLRPNLTLDMSASYETLSGEYKSNCKRNLKKSQQQNQKLSKNLNIEDYLNFIKTNAGSRPIIGLLNILENILTKAIARNAVEIWSAINEENSEILACIFFLKWKNRVYYLVPISSEEGKQKQSMSFLVDRFIEESAGKNLILDFEGSAMIGIAKFYEGFGAERSFYPVIKKNELPFPIKNLLK